MQVYVSVLYWIFGLHLLGISQVSKVYSVLMGLLWELLWGLEEPAASSQGMM